jgi:hypothetical protein
MVVSNCDRRHNYPYTRRIRRSCETSVVSLPLNSGLFSGPSSESESEPATLGERAYISYLYLGGKSLAGNIADLRFCDEFQARSLLLQP